MHGQNRERFPGCVTDHPGSALPQAESILIVLATDGLTVCARLVLTVMLQVAAGLRIIMS